MRIYVAYLRDEAGYHRYFHTSRQLARNFIADQRANPDPNCQPDAGEPGDDIDVLDVPTGKNALVKWLNANCENAAKF